MAESSQNSMTPVDDATGLRLPPHLKAKLEDFQQRLWSVKIAEGALAGLVGLGLTFLAVFVVDRFIDTPFAIRLSLLLFGFAVPALVIPLRWQRWVKNQRSLEQIARLLRRRYPRLGDELLGIVELSRSSQGQNSRVLVEAAMAQVDERIKDQDFEEAVPANRYGLWLTGAVSVLTISGALLFFVSGAAGSSLARWIAPARDVDRYTFARIDPLPPEVVVPYGEKFELAPHLADTTEWKPDTATVKLPGATRLRSERGDDRFDFTIPPRKEAGTLGLRVGDEYRKIEVTPLPRPELTDLTATLRLPDYLLYESDQVIPVRGNSLSIVSGTVTTLSGTISRDLATAKAGGEPATISGDRFSTRPFTVEDTVVKEITWEDIHGLTAKDSLTIQVNPVADHQPDIFARQITQERIVLPDEVISFDLSASDDFGIRTMGLEWYGQLSDEGTYATKGEKAVAAGAPEKRAIETRATFSAAREGVPPQTVQIRAFAEDYLPDRERSYSPTFVLHILAPAEHAEWLTQEFGKWLRNAREVYEREKQLNESNRALRELPAEELDSPENRRKLGEQASAESANAKRLDALTKAGRDLVKQATKNDEFDAQRLEKWSEMMRTLDGIANERMPSVADLLRQSSRAPGAPPASGKQSDSTTPPEAGEDAPPSPPALTDRESSIGEPEAPEPGDSGEKEPSPPAAPGLPETTLAGGKTPPAPKPESPAGELLDKAVTEQEALLADFAKVADELQEILSSLEASTFVKRLKAASRKQTELAAAMTETLSPGFGLPRHRIEQQWRDVGTGAAESSETQSTLVYEIQTDLEAYYQRKQDGIYKNVLDQMKQSAVVSRLKEIGQQSEGNLSGRSISSSEFWADTLDRWAEELVAAAKEGQSSEGGSKEGLPPEIVLQIMKVLQEQMYLRDETREMESVRPALAGEVYESKVIPLELSQRDLRERVDFVIEDIRELPEASKNFGAELQLLNLVSDTMRQARGILARPDTGPEVIAAQTEAIELLLQSKRQQNSAGGGSGGSSPGAGGQAAGGSSALSDIGMPGAASDGSAGAPREVEQSTGNAGRVLPEEFRRGLDTYFNAIETNE